MRALSAHLSRVVDRRVREHPTAQPGLFCTSTHTSSPLQLAFQPQQRTPSPPTAAPLDPTKSRCRLPSQPAPHNTHHNRLLHAASATPGTGRASPSQQSGATTVIGRCVPNVHTTIATWMCPLEPLRQSPFPSIRSRPFDSRPPRRPSGIGGLGSFRASIIGGLASTCIWLIGSVQSSD